jgi:hypothetical protein
VRRSDGYAGSPIVAANAGATTGPDPTPACQTVTRDLWFSFTAPCFGLYTASTCSAVTDFTSVVSVWTGTCGALVPVTCSDVCAGGGFQGASATFQATGGVTYLVSVGGAFGATGTFELRISLGAAMSMFLFGGTAGTMGYVITEGPELGTAFVAVTANQGSFPQGWFFGLDIPWLELLTEFGFGFPFLTQLGPCGVVGIGPFPGIPSGVTLYAVALAWPAGGAVPTWVSLPVMGTVP